MYRLIASMALGGILATSLSARVILDRGHMDLVFEFDDGAWEAEVELHGVGEYEPEDVVLQANMNTLQQRPAGAAFNFLGAEGSLVNILPEVDPGAPYDRLWIGFEVEDEEGAFLNNQATLTFSNFVTPNGGDMFLWQEDALGNPVLYFSSDMGFPGAGSFVYDDLTLEDHAHFNWAFTEFGDYLADITITADLTGGGQTSITETYAFQAIPEPSTYAVIVGALVLGVVLLRRRGFGGSRA